MTPRRWGLLALAVAGLGWALGGEWVSIHHGVAENHLIDALGGLAFLAGGLTALDRRPGNAIGALMLTFGFAWFLGNWGNLNVAVLPLLGAVSGYLGPPLLAHIVLAYPSGRLPTRFGRAVAAFIYAAGAGVCAGGADPARGTGLRGLADRVSAVRGWFGVESPPGHGTRVVAEIPCDG